MNYYHRRRLRRPPELDADAFAKPLMIATNSLNTRRR